MDNRELFGEVIPALWVVNQPDRIGLNIGDFIGILK
jgi:hypothetical protein